MQEKPLIEWGKGSALMRFQTTIVGVVFAIFATSCADEVLNKSTGTAAISEDVTDPGTVDSGEPDLYEEESDSPPLEILAGVGIGPAKLGDTYGDLVRELGPPDTSFEYYRIVFAVWLA